MTTSRRSWPRRRRSRLLASKSQRCCAPIRQRASKPAQMRWRLRRCCSDVVEEVANARYLDSDEVFDHPEQCPACGRKPSVIVDAGPIGLAGRD